MRRVNAFDLLATPSWTEHIFVLSSDIVLGLHVSRFCVTRVPRSLLRTKLTLLAALATILSQDADAPVSVFMSVKSLQLAFEYPETFLSDSTEYWRSTVHLSRLSFWWRGGDTSSSGPKLSRACRLGFMTHGISTIVRNQRFQDHLSHHKFFGLAGMRLFLSSEKSLMRRVNASTFWRCHGRDISSSLSSRYLFLDFQCPVYASSLSEESSEDELTLLWRLR
ncbi:hypothetical protein Tco_0045184 [Tanacetum coccineum]